MNTNQAFIKAYRHDGAQPLSAGHVTEAGAPSHVGPHLSAAAVRSAKFAHAEAFGATVSYVSPATAEESGFDSLPVTVEAASLAEAPISPYGPDMPHFSDPILAAPYTAMQPTAIRPVPVKRPLSSFMKSAAGSTATSMTLRPGTTVATFRLPEACRNLLARHGQTFDRITDSLLQLADDGRALVGVLGMFRGVGSTTITLCLAARLADRARRVAVVDGHFQSPQLCSCLDAEPTAWWQDVLQRGAALGDALVRAEDDEFDLLPLDPYARTAPHALQLAATAGALRHAYDIVLVDLGTFFDPVSQSTALELMRQMRIDAAVAVAGPGSHDPRDLETVAERLNECGCELLGTIENRVIV